MEDLERFTRRSRLEGVSCGQKSYKSEQIEQINVDEKRFGRFGKICGISRRSQLKKSVPHNSHPNPTLTGGPPDNTQLYV